MGYRTVMAVPTLRDYNEAFNKFNKSKPIKGRGEDKRPLGERRYVDTYSIRKNVWTDAIECVLYQTPVVTYTVEDEVKIKFGRWSSASTCQFIDQLLWNVSANRVRGDVVLHFNNGTKALVRDHEELVLVRNKRGEWVPKEEQTLYDYRINRKEANNVRKMVSQFRDYLAGVVKLKEEKTTLYGEECGIVRVNYAELFDVFGMEQEANGSGRVRPDVDKWIGIDNKPRYWRPEEKSMMWQEYGERTEKFFDLIKNDQDDNVRHQNYWIAFNVLAVQTHRFWWREPEANFDVTVNRDRFEKILDKALFTMFSDKVFKRVALAEGKVPTGKYDDYVLTEEDE